MWRSFQQGRRVLSPGRWRDTPRLAWSPFGSVVLGAQQGTPFRLFPILAQGRHSTFTPRLRSHLLPRGASLAPRPSSSISLCSPQVSSSVCV